LVTLYPSGVLQQFPKLKAVFSLLAGVNHFVSDQNFPHPIPVVRLMDPHMASDISQYVAACVLNYVKRLDHWKAKQQQNAWFRHPPFSFADRTIGLMGLGFLGRKSAETLQALDLNVIGWSQSRKNLTGITSYAGQSEFNDFLAHTDILICMLPLTEQTQNILNKNTFAHLRPGAYLINLGRGEHLVEEDVIPALDSGQLSGATLDVFREEPLPVAHPFWAHPHIFITPHIASVTNPATAALQVLQTIQQLQQGQTLSNTLDFAKGY
ncbi:MAG: 2-hydroxyacid dehydrogenase, partial [Gammaproteobacteria bacterium]